MNEKKEDMNINQIISAKKTSSNDENKPVVDMVVQKNYFDINNIFHSNNKYLKNYDKFLNSEREGRWLYYNWLVLVTQPFMYIYYKMFMELAILSFIFGFLLGYSVPSAILFLFIHPLFFFKLYKNKQERIIFDIIKKQEKFNKKYAKEIRESLYFKKLSKAEKEKEIRKRKYLKFDYSSLNVFSMYNKKSTPVGFISFIPAFLAGGSIFVYAALAGATFTNSIAEQNMNIVMTELNFLENRGGKITKEDLNELKDLTKLTNLSSSIVINYLEYQEKEAK